MQRNKPYIFKETATYFTVARSTQAVVAHAGPVPRPHAAPSAIQYHNWVAVRNTWAPVPGCESRSSA